jgi:NADH:ubiquinone oxidoreductase subunit 6 (subunit J)
VSNPMFPEPMPPIGGSEKPAKPPVPKEVNISFAVWVLSMVLSSILQIVDADVFVETYQKQLANQSPEAQLSAGTLKGVYLVAVIAVGLVMLLFAWKMRQGRNWARILLTVLAVTSLLVQASSVGVSSVLGLIGVVITATGLVFMYMPAANAYFAHFRQQRLERRRR